jgi:hypothetical protein
MLTISWNKHVLSSLKGSDSYANLIKCIILCEIIFQLIYTDYANYAYFDKRSHLNFLLRTLWIKLDGNGPLVVFKIVVCCPSFKGGCRGRNGMVVGFTPTYVISLYHHWCCGFESWSGRGVQHYVIKFVSDLWQVSGFLRSSGFLHQ